jgi:hypothetical protein
MKNLPEIPNVRVSRQAVKGNKAKEQARQKREMTNVVEGTLPNKGVA